GRHQPVDSQDIHPIHRSQGYFLDDALAAMACGFRERGIEVRSNTTLNLAEKPGDSGTPLLLIPGQGCIWQEYSRVLPRLAESLHVIVVDVHGHGRSSWNPSDYRAGQIADDLTALIRQVFDEPALIAGHSSGGLLAARMAARHPSLVRGVLLEDAPFFATEPDRVPRTYVGIDNYANVSSFLAQDSERDWVCWYMPRSYWKPMFGPLWTIFTRAVTKQRRADPTAAPWLRWVPESINRIWESISHPYDLRFTAAFIDDSWFKGYDQDATLSTIRCPTTFLKASTRRSRGGILLAALDDNDLNRVERLLPDNQTTQVRSSHDIHFAQPEAYVAALEALEIRTNTGGAE
ncbi:MAG: alpha/beta fold hydrolase, partial [Brevibacterium sp.]